MDFSRFETITVDVGNGVSLLAKVAGSGQPLLLLHGYPQNHMCWHKVAPALVEAGYRVVVPDLRGYGGSSKPASDKAHSPYAKRAMAGDQLALMQALGHERFLLAGHDRGGRVAHRLAVDHPHAVHKLAVLDIAPTLAMYEGTDQAFATSYYHWFFLIQPEPLPEKMIGADPEWYLRRKIGSWARIEGTFTDAAMASYVADFAKPETIHATCEDYRAAASIDLDHARADIAAGRMIECPVLALWGGQGFAAKSYDILALWRDVARGPVIGEALDCGHFLPEELPDETTRALTDFFGN
ncbi:MAG: alpha/beta hydrolase [Rhizobiales bacterium]|nr:alpha/beta hydrolase [Hyphomicrobiales bacterium]